MNKTTVSYTVLSPMAGVTDMSYRTICHEMGADLDGY